MRHLVFETEDCASCENIAPCPSCSPDQTCQQIYPSDCRSCPTNICLPQSTPFPYGLLAGSLCGAVCVVALIVGLYLVYRRLQDRKVQAEAPTPSVLPPDFPETVYLPTPPFKATLQRYPMPYTGAETTIPPNGSVLETDMEGVQRPTPSSASGGTPPILTKAYIYESLMMRNVSRQPHQSGAVRPRHAPPVEEDVPQRPTLQLGDSYYEREREALYDSYRMNHNPENGPDGVHAHHDEQNEHAEETAVLSRGSQEYAFMNTLLDEYEDKEDTGSASPCVDNADQPMHNASTSQAACTARSGDQPEDRTADVTQNPGVLLPAQSLLSNEQTKENEGRTRTPEAECEEPKEVCEPTRKRVVPRADRKERSVTCLINEASTVLMEYAIRHGMMQTDGPNGGDNHDSHQRGHLPGRDKPGSATLHNNGSIRLVRAESFSHFTTRDK